MYYVRSFLKKYWAILLIFLIPIPSLFWLPPNHLFSSGLTYPLPPGDGIINFMKVYMYAWANITGFASPNYDTTSILYYGLLGLFNYFTESVHYAQSLFLYINYIGIIGGMYVLCRTLRLNHSASLFAGVFYLFTPSISTGMPFSPIGVRVLSFYVFLPVTTAVLIQTLKSQTIKAWCFFGIVSFLATISFSSLQYFIIQNTIHLFLIFFVFLGVKNKCTKFNFFTSTFLKFTGIVLFSNSYWMIPLFTSFNAYYVYRGEPGFSDSALLSGTGFTFLDGFRFLPYPIKDLYQWAPFYYGPFLTFIAFLFTFLAILALLSKENRQKSILFSIILITALFLGKGTKNPLSELGSFIFLSIPYITRLFRNLTYLEIPVIFATAVLIAISLHNIISILKHQGKVAVLSLSVLLIFSISVYGIPFFSGSYMKDNPLGTSMSLTVPNYYKEIADFLGQDNNLFRILSIPTFSRQDSYVVYDWGDKYYGPQMLNVWAEKPVIRAIFPLGVSSYNPVIQSVMSPRPPFNDKDLAKLRLWNVRYITLHRDFDWNLFRTTINSEEKSYQPEWLDAFVLNLDHVSKVAMFDKVEIFKISDEIFVPYIYTVQNPVLINESINEISDNFTIVDKSAFLLLKDLNAEQTKLIREHNSSNENIPKTTFKRMNPTKYYVKIENATEPFILIFSESYNPQWKAYLSNDETDIDISSTYESFRVKEARHEHEYAPQDIGYLFKVPLNENKHFQANGFFNAWYLDPKEFQKENFTIVLYFLPQSQFYIGATITGLFFLICIGYLIFGWIREKNMLLILDRKKRRLLWKK